MQVKYIFLLILTFYTGHTQFKAQCIFKGTVDLIREDHLQNWYCYSQNTLIKGGAQMPRLQFFSTLKYGALTHLDVQNPMSVVLYFKTYQTVLFLDNVLVQKSEPLKLDVIGYPQTEWVCSSQQQGIWLYNQANAELLKLDRFGNCILKTGNLAQYYRHVFEPLYMCEFGTFLYVIFKNKGLWIFDRFGALKQQLAFPNTNNIVVDENNISACSSNFRFQYDFKTAILDSVPLQNRTNRQYIGPQHFFEIFKDSVYASHR